MFLPHHVHLLSLLSPPPFFPKQPVSDTCNIPVAGVSGKESDARSFIINSVSGVSSFPVKLLLHGLLSAASSLPAAISFNPLITKASQSCSSTPAPLLQRSRHGSRIILLHLSNIFLTLNKFAVPPHVSACYQTSKHAMTCSTVNVYYGENSRVVFHLLAASLLEMNPPGI